MYCFTCHKLIQSFTILISGAFLEMNSFKKQAQTFVQLFDRKEARMNAIMQQLQKIAAEGRKIRKETELWIIIGAVALLAGAVLAMSSASATNGLSFTLYGIATAWGLFVGLCIILKRKYSELFNSAKITNLTEEFCLLVQPLMDSLEGVKKSCGSLRRTSVTIEALKYIRMEVKILELFYITEKLRTNISCVIERAEEVMKVIEEFRKMKMDFQTS